MSQIDALLAELCPSGVSFKPIGEFCELVRGNGMPKADFVDAGVGCIHYGQIYTIYDTWTTTTRSFIPPEKAKRLAKVDPGDVRDDVGNHGSVDDALYLLAVEATALEQLSNCEFAELNGVERFEEGARSGERGPDSGDDGDAAGSGAGHLRYYGAITRCERKCFGARHRTPLQILKADCGTSPLSWEYQILARCWQ